MPLDIGSETWSSLDQWWDTFADTQPPTVASETTMLLAPRSTTELPGEMDPWWNTFVESYAPVQTEQRVAAIDNQAYSDTWTDLDP